MHQAIVGATAGLLISLAVGPIAGVVGGLATFAGLFALTWTLGGESH